MSILSCFSSKSKNSLLWLYWWIKSFSFLGAISSSESNLHTLTDTGKVCSKVVLFFKIGNSRVSVQIVNLVQVNGQKLYSPWNTWPILNLIHDMLPKIPKENCFLLLCCSYTIHFYLQVTYGWLGILTGIIIIHTADNVFIVGQFANIISFPASSTVVVISDFL